MNIQERYRKPIEEFVRRALEGYGDRVESIILFGSVARGEGKEDSDVDILVIWKGDKLEGWDILEDIAMDILLEYRQLISIKIIYTHEYLGMVNVGSSFIQNIKKEGVVIEKYYSKALAKGKDIREVADYDVIAEITEEEAESVIVDAERFLERIKVAINEIAK